MKEITLLEWARRNHVSLRTAQDWAKKQRIPARKRKLPVQITKIWTCWVVPNDTPTPGVSS